MWGTTLVRKIFRRNLASSANNMSKYLAVGPEEYIAYNHTPGKSPGVIFLPGFMSNMNGTKALALERFCGEIGHSYTRFDYRGHGKSSGRHEECSVGMRKQDALAVLGITEGKIYQVTVCAISYPEKQEGSGYEIAVCDKPHNKNHRRPN